MNDKKITIALSKGRIFKDTLPLFKHADIEPVEHPVKTRKLIIETNQADVRFLIVRATDVPTYVQYGAADMGVSGKDVIIEHGGDGYYEPLDLKIANCRLMVASPIDEIDEPKKLRIATKYVNSAKKYFAEKGQQVEIIKLYGSMELAPLINLSDRIVDLVETGNTLKANGLKPTEHIRNISSRLIINRASMKMKHQKIKEIMNALEEAVTNKSQQK